MHNKLENKIVALKMSNDEVKNLSLENYTIEE